MRRRGQCLGRPLRGVSMACAAVLWGNGTHVVSAENAHYFAASVELHENALLEVL